MTTFTSTSILPLCKDLAQFLFSFLHLLLTRILPLIAILVGSLLLHLSRFTISLLFRKPAPSRRKFKRRRRPVPQDRYSEPLTTFADAPPEPNMGSSDESDDELAEYSTLQAECYEDCEDEDSHNVEQRDQWLAEKRIELENYEWEDNWTSESDGMDAEDDDNQYEDVEDTWQEVGDGEDEARDAWAQAEVGNTNYSAQKVGDKEERVGDGVQELVSELADEEEVGDRLERPILSQRSMSFPSDLPPTLDNVIIAAAVNNHAQGAAGRPLAPTFSSVAAALQESSASSARKPAADHQPTDAAPLPTRTPSYRQFEAKFNQHFMLGDDD